MASPTTETREERAGERGLQWKQGICGICPAGCWVEVGLNKGRMEAIRPQEGHPLGMLCRRGEHAPEIVYSEHRFKYPMRRVGPKGTLECRVSAKVRHFRTEDSGR